jgi:hypothetical protein
MASQVLRFLSDTFSEYARHKSRRGDAICNVPSAKPALYEVTRARNKRMEAIRVFMKQRSGSGGGR